MKLYGALEAGGTKMVCAIGDENGNILERISIPTRTPAETMGPMIDFFRGKGIRALGIGCFGPVDLKKGSRTYGYITSTPKLAWQNYPIVAEFEKALGVPVGFDTDVNAAALGEATWGCTRDVENSIYITVGTGVGVGVIIGGKPYHGMLHPEGGHILLARHPDDPMVGSGCPFHENCLEGLAAGPSLEKRWGIKGAELTGRKEVWQLEAYYIGQALADYILILSPERIVLGGGVTHQEGLLALIRQETAKQLAGYIRTAAIDHLDSYIVGVSLNDNQGVMGAVKLAMDAEKETEK
ncbi:MAG: ROK family protein [Clostridiales bacterium]|nr:ROK family protein [Clostridiales bacterium]MCI7573457.1 ROK family protein [Clostridiales bacterium]MDY5641528.1 ROK family protein [Candidatus Faecousia sp.]